MEVQNDTQQIIGDGIEKAIQETGLKQVCCSGGYFLNCVTNYYLHKTIPRHRILF
jgi:carbamoyltransferase